MINLFKCLPLIVFFFIVAPPIAESAPARFQCPHPVSVKDFSSNETVTFLTFGDSGHASPEHIKLTDAMKAACDRRKCDFAVTVGDNIYEKGVKNVRDPQFQTKFENLYKKFGRFDFWMILGNHDVRGNAEAQVQYSCMSDRWRMPARSYMIPRLPDWMQIYGIDTSNLAKDCWFCSYSDVLTQFRQAMCSRTQSWKFVFGHHPIVSAGRGFDPKNGAKMRERLLPVLGECGIHVYFSGHDHHQEHIKVDLDGVRFDQIIQGAASEVSGKTPQNKVLGPQHLFTKAEYGFAITTVTRKQVAIEFFGLAGESLYKYSSQFSDRIVKDTREPVDRAPSQNSR